MTRRALNTFLVLWVLPGTVWSQTSTGTVTVNFAASPAVNSASGLLFGSTPSTAPNTLAPLQPRLWRFADFCVAPTYTTCHSWAALAQHFQSIVPQISPNLLLAQDWGFPVNNWNGVNAPPWQNWTAYETHLRTLVRTLKAQGLTGTWEVWNEPDIPDFWNGTRAQFHELYGRAYTVIRAEVPDADVGGPTLGIYNHAAVEAFLEYCLAQGCQVNTLIFHANDDTPEGIAAFPNNVRDARQSFLENPRYAPLHIRRIVINEIGGPVYTHQPGGTLAHYAAFEEGGAAAGARSCWNDSAGASECFNGTLDGLLTAGSLQPRAVWWAHKLYADGVPTRVTATTSGPNVVSLASRQSETAAPQVLVGHVDFQRTLNHLPGSLTAHLILRGLAALPQFRGAFRIVARLESIPNTGEAALAAPIPLGTVEANVINGVAQVALRSLSVGQVVRVTLLPSDNQRRPADLDGDGIGDIVLQHENSFVAAWRMNAAGQPIAFQPVAFYATGGWNVVGRADLNQDGIGDIILQHTNSWVAAWLMNGTGQPTTFVPIAFYDLAGWKVAGTADLNQDGITDILLQHSNSFVAAWTMNLEGQPVSFSPVAMYNLGSWRVAATADLNGDGITDIVLQHGNSFVAAWLMNAVGLPQSFVPIASYDTGGWKVAGAADVNGDGVSDLILQHRDSYVGAWLMNGTAVPNAFVWLAPYQTGGWRVVGG